MNGVVDIDAEQVDGAIASAGPSPDEVVSALAAFPEDLGRAIADRPAEVLARPSRDGGWGVVEILPHLRDWEEIFLARVLAVLAEDRPSLSAYDDELWAIERDYRGQDPRRTLDRFRTLRGELVAALRDLPPEAWARAGEHEVAGPVTLRWLVERIRAHDREHLDQIRDALA